LNCSRPQNCLLIGARPVGAIFAGPKAGTISNALGHDTSRLFECSAQTDTRVRGMRAGTGTFGQTSSGWRQNKSLRRRRRKYPIPSVRKSQLPSEHEDFRNRCWRSNYVGEQYWTRTGHLIDSQLYQSSAHNPLLLAGTISVLGVAALLAFLFPVRHASMVNPVAALRVE